MNFFFLSTVACPHRPGTSFLLFLPSNILLENLMTAGQDGPQRPLRAEEEAAVGMIFTGPLQQALNQIIERIFFYLKCVAECDKSIVVVYTGCLWTYTIQKRGNWFS